MIRLIGALILGIVVVGLLGCNRSQSQEAQQDKPSLIDRAKKGLLGENKKTEESILEAEPEKVTQRNYAKTKGDSERPETTEPAKKTSKTRLAWFWDWITFPNWGFWLACIAAFILISLYAEYESYEDYKGWQYFGNGAMSLLVATLIWVNRGFLVELWNTWHWWGLIAVLGIFTVSGVINFWIRWELKTSDALDKIKEREQVFLKSDPNGKDPATGQPYKEVPDDKAVIQARNEYFSRERWSLDLPRRAENKALLTKWACTGPVSLPGTIVVNGMRIFGNVVYNWFGWLAERITRRYEGQIRR